MLHTKFRENRPPVSGVFTLYGHGGHLGHVTQMSGTNFFSLPKEAPHKIWL